MYGVENYDVDILCTIWLFYLKYISKTCDGLFIQTLMKLFEKTGKFCISKKW